MVYRLSVAGFCMTMLVACASLPQEPIPQPVPPWPHDMLIMDYYEVPREIVVSYLMNRNSGAERVALERLWTAYADACTVEGVSMLVALAQMMHETDYLRFSGTVSPSQNNFAGIGTVDKNTPGNVFPNPATGVLAQVQHLKAYASVAPLNAALVDPRFRFVKRGQIATARELALKWAADPAYGDKLMLHANRLMVFWRTGKLV